MSYRYVDANDVVDIVDMKTQNKINEMDCVYIDGIKPNNQHFNLAEHDKQIRDEVIEKFVDAISNSGKGHWRATAYEHGEVVSETMSYDIGTIRLIAEQMKRSKNVKCLH